MFLELYRGGLDKILALCSRKCLGVCTRFDRSHCAQYYSATVERLKREKRQSCTYFTFYLNSRQNIISYT